jgi:hypothetical protein
VGKIQEWGGSGNPFRLNPTPDANCYKGGADGQLRRQLNGSLNPAWVEWLMGYPKDWTSLPPGPKKIRKSRVSPSVSQTASPGSKGSATPSSRKSRRASLP